MKATTSPHQRAASRAALLDDGSSNYWEAGASPSDPAVLVKPKWRLLGLMVTAYVRHYHPTADPERHKELRDMVREEWLSEIPDEPGMEFSAGPDCNISDLQCGFTPERLPCWAWEMGTPEPLLGAAVVPASGAEAFGADYLALEGELDPYARLDRLKQWARGLHPVECHNDTLKRESYVPEYTGALDEDLSEANYHAMLRGQSVTMPPAEDDVSYVYLEIYGMADAGLDLEWAIHTRGQDEWPTRDELGLTQASTWPSAGDVGL